MLETLARASEGLDVELVQIDNASEDGSADLISKHWDGKLVQRINSINAGFATALKQAVDEARGEALLVLNPDVRLIEHSLRTLVGRLQSDQTLGAVGPLVRRPDGSVELVCARRMPTLLECAVEAAGLRSVLQGTLFDPYTYPRSSYTRARDVPCLSGAAMLVRASALDTAGGVDDRFFMYFEDVDTCERLRRHGFRVHFCPDAEVIHISEASSPRSPALETWLATHNAAAMNVYFATYRGPAAARTHRALVGMEGVLRTVLGVFLRRKRPRLLDTGVAKVRWALTRRMPAGAPAGFAAWLGILAPR